MTTQLAKRRVLDKQRQYSGQQDALPVIEWLNRNSGSRPARRIAGLIRDLKSLWGSRPPVWQVPTREDVAWLEKHYPETRKLNLRELAERRWPKAWQTAEPAEDHDPTAFERARSQLSRYAFRPWLFPPFFRGETGSGLSVVWMPSRLLTRGRQVTMQDASGMGREQEAWVVALLVGLTEDGLISKICECSCGVWFFAWAQSQHWCSTRCRHRDYKSSPEFKKHRREYMRKYYRDNLSKESARRRPIPLKTQKGR